MFTRLFFLSTAVVSLAGAMLMGGALAWQTADSARGAAIVGSNGLQVHYEPHCPSPRPLPADVVVPADDGVADSQAAEIACLTLIGPNGTRSLVGNGTSTNTGDFKLRVTGGDLRVTHVFNRENATDLVRACGVDDFSGAVSVTGSPDLAPGQTGAEFGAFVGLGASAPANCQSDVVLYRVTIEAENPLPPIGTDPVQPLDRQ